MKKLTALVLFTAAAAAVSVLALLLSFTPVAKVEGVTVPALQGECAYVLREYEGCVAIYCGERSAVPTTVTDIEVRMLPEQDRRLLSGGIGVDDPGELSMLLEDLGS